MFKKNIIKPDELQNENLVVYKQIEKLKTNAKVVVDTKHRAVIIKDGNVSEVLQSGEYKPFTKDDKKKRVVIAFVYVAKISELEFSTRVSSVKDNVQGAIYNLSFSGKYTFAVRNERKFLGTCFNSGSDFSRYDFYEEIEKSVNANILSYIIDFFVNGKVPFEKFEKANEKLNHHVETALDKYLDDTFGLEVRSVNVTEMFIQDKIATK